MDLFVVNRFQGDAKPNASDEKTKLEKVLKKIKKRKLARERGRQKENLKVNKVSKFKKVKKLKAEVKKLKTKVNKGLLLNKGEAKRALKIKAVKIEDLAVKINKGQVFPTQEAKKQAQKLIEEGVVKPEPKVPKKSAETKRPLKTKAAKIKVLAVKKNKRQVFPTQGAKKQAQKLIKTGVVKPELKDPKKSVEAKRPLKTKAVKNKVLAVKINKGQVFPTQEAKKQAQKLINAGVVKPEPKNPKKPAIKKTKKGKKSVEETNKPKEVEQKKEELKSEKLNKSIETNEEKKEKRKRKKQAVDEESNEEDKIVELSPEEISEKLLQKQIEELNKSSETNEDKKVKSKRKKEAVNEDKIVELSPEEIAEKLLQKQIEELNKSSETSEEEKVKRNLKEQTVVEESNIEAEDKSSETNVEKKVKRKRKKQTPTTEDKTKKPKKQKKPSEVPEDSGFTILGVDKFAKKKTVKRVLPKWLRNPTIISSDLTNLKEKISSAQLNPQLKQKLQEKQIEYLFPVQAEFLPWQLKSSKISGLIAPQDACISAPTGSGKTLAFTIPVLQSLLHQLENRCLTIKAIRALIILPTQSLALQIYDTFKSLISGSDINVGLATGAGNRTLEAEQKQLITCNSIWGPCSKVDILVCTAGRLVDHLKSTKGFDLTHLQYIIIDEADRVLDSIQDDWLYHLGIHLRQDAAGNLINRNIVNVASVRERTDPQKLLFSATLSQDPEKLQKLSLFQPKLFSCVSENDNTAENLERFIGKYTTPAELTEKYITCTIDIKPLVLYKLIIDEIDKNAKSRILVFVNTVETLHRLNVLLKYMGQEKFTVAEFSSGQGNLKVRQTILKKFEEGLVQVLVCTDSMARGIDIPNVDCVVSYSVPKHLKTYIHRAGRTARAGSTGLCISIMHAKQQKSFLAMIESMRAHAKCVEEVRIPENDLEILTPLYEQCLVQLKEKVSDEAEKSAKRIKTRKLAFNKRKNRKIRKSRAVRAT